MSTETTNMLQLPVVTGLDGTESVWVIQGGTDKRCTISQIAAFSGSGGAFAIPIVVTDVTDPGDYTVPDSALWVIIDKTDGGDVILPALADKVGQVLIVGAQATAFPFNVVTTDGDIMGSLSTYPFTSNYQAATFGAVADLATWTVS